MQSAAKHIGLFGLLAKKRMKCLFIICCLCIPLFGVAQVSPSDSLKKYQKLAMRDLDSLRKYEKKAGWNEHYFNLSEKRRAQIKYWIDYQYLLDKQKRRKP